jgi:hypothetical protein
MKKTYFPKVWKKTAEIIEKIMWKGGSRNVLKQMVRQLIRCFAENECGWDGTRTRESEDDSGPFMCGI